MDLEYRWPREEVLEVLDEVRAGMVRGGGEVELLLPVEVLWMELALSSLLAVLGGLAGWIGGVILWTCWPLFFDEVKNDLLREKGNSPA